MSTHPQQGTIRFHAAGQIEQPLPSFRMRPAFLELIAQQSRWTFDCQSGTRLESSLSYLSLQSTKVMEERRSKEILVGVGSMLAGISSLPRNGHGALIQQIPSQHFDHWDIAGYGASQKKAARSQHPICLLQSPEPVIPFRQVIQRAEDLRPSHTRSTSSY